MTKDQKYSCMSELGAEFLMVITSFIIAISILFLFLQSAIYSRFISRNSIISDKVASLILSSAYALFLPLMSYMFSQAKHYNQEERAQVILIWMVIIEMIRILGDPIFAWGLPKSAEQMIRLFWVAFLVYGYEPLHGLKASLFLLCVFLTVYEVLRGIMFNMAKDNYRIGKNPKLIHNYVKRIILQDDHRTTPMNNCDYIVMGEQNHEIVVCSSGYHLGKKKSNSEGMLTIGRVFQLTSSEDEVFTLANPYWRDNCLSVALAKMLRRRFTKLPVDEAGCRKALDFVLEGLIDYIGSNQDIKTDGNGEERNPMERVFSIIQGELKFVSEILDMKALTANYNLCFLMAHIIGAAMMLGNGIYLLSSCARLSFIAHEAHNHCFFHKHDSVAVKFFSYLDLIITLLLLTTCLYIIFAGMMEFHTVRFCSLIDVKSYFKDPAKWIRSNNSSVACKWWKAWKLLSHLEHYMKVSLKALGNLYIKDARVYSSILDAEAEIILFCIYIDLSILARLPKSIRRIISRITSLTVVHSTGAKETILRSLRNSGGRLTNGEISLKKYGMEHLIWACQPNGSTTEAILVWHIATTLFHHQKPSLQQNNISDQEPPPQQNNNPLKEQEVALVLSSYCHYLVKSLPELLPDEVEWTEEMYETVRTEILAIALFFVQKPTKEDRCNFALHAMWVESSVLGKGAMLAKDLMNCGEDGKQVWNMLAEFWAEMMLFIAPSDNVEAHEKILERGELITQLWALLTHAGIVARPKPTTHHDHESENNVVTGDMNV